MLLGNDVIIALIKILSDLLLSEDKLRKLGSSVISISSLDLGLCKHLLSESQILLSFVIEILIGLVEANSIVLTSEKQVVGLL